MRPGTRHWAPRLSLAIYMSVTPRLPDLGPAASGSPGHRPLQKVSTQRGGSPGLAQNAEHERPAEFPVRRGSASQAIQFRALPIRERPGISTIRPIEFGGPSPQSMIAVVTCARPGAPVGGIRCLKRQRAPGSVADSRSLRAWVVWVSLYATAWFQPMPATRARISRARCSPRTSVTIKLIT